MADENDDDRRDEAPIDAGDETGSEAEPDADPGAETEPRREMDVDPSDGPARGNAEPERGPAGARDPGSEAGPDDRERETDTPDRGRSEAGDAAQERGASDTADRTGAGRAGAESNRTGGPTAGERPDENRIATEDRRRKAPVVSGIVAAIGAWVALSPAVFDGFGDAALWNNVAVGAAIFLAAGYNYYRVYRDRPASAGVASLVAVLGLWLLVAAAILETSWGAVWSTAASGGLVAVMAGYNAYEARAARSVAGAEGDPGAG